MIGEVEKLRMKASEVAKATISEDCKKPVVLADKFDKLRKLDCFEAVKSRLIHGHSTTEVAKYIVSAGELEKLEMTFHSLEMYLCDFRELIKSSEMVSRYIPEFAKELEERLKSGIDEIQELEYLYMMQRDRIEIDYATEKKIHKLFKSTGNEVAIAMGILKLMMGIKQELGIRRKELGRVEVDHTLLVDMPYKSKAMEEVLSDPASRSKVLGMVRRMLSRSDFSGKEFEGIEEVRKVVEAEATVVPDKLKEPEYERVMPELIEPPSEVKDVA